MSRILKVSSAVTVGRFNPGQNNMGSIIWSPTFPDGRNDYTIWICISTEIWNCMICRLSQATFKLLFAQRNLSVDIITCVYSWSIWWFKKAGLFLCINILWVDVLKCRSIMFELWNWIRVYKSYFHFWEYCYYPLHCWELQVFIRWYISW